MLGRFWTAAVAAALISTSSTAAVIDLYAIDTASPRLASSTDANADNRLRAYNSLTQIDGWIRFDLSSIVDTATISSIELTLFSEGAFGTPFGNPTVQVFRSSYDSWSRGDTGFPSVLDEVLTGIDNGPFPSAHHDPYTFVLDGSAVDWSADLLDNTLSLIIRNDAASSWTYWFGSDPVTASGSANDSGTVLAYRPTLTVTYDLAPIPLPASVSLMLLGLAGLAGLRTRKHLAT